MKRGGVTIPYVERRLEIPKGLLRAWVAGTNGISPGSIVHITALEAFFELPPGSLVGMLPGKLNGRRSSRKEGPTLSELHTTRVVRHLPADFRERPLEERLAVVDDVNRTIIRQDRPYSVQLAALVKQPYRLKIAAWPEAARDEWTELVAFKTSDLTPIDMERADDAPWGGETTNYARLRLERFYGHATLGEDQGGLGFGVDAVGLWMLAAEPLVQHYIEWCRSRRGGGWNMGETTFLSFAASLVRKSVGFIYQAPDLADRMVARAKATTTRGIDNARSDWAGHCAKAELRFRKLAKDVKKAIKDEVDPEVARTSTRDPFEPILVLLTCDRPMDEYRRLDLLMQGRSPDLSKAPAYHHQHRRDCVMTRLLRLLCFRAKNMRKMTWRADNTGHLRKVDGQYIVTVPRRQFKNHNGPFFGPPKNKRDYYRVLKDVDGLYAMLDYYVTTSRPFLLNGNKHDFLLVTHGGTAYDHSGFNKGYKSITEKHFAYNPHTGTGMKGLMPHSPHAVRHVMVTHVVKATGRFDLGGAAIQDSEDAARKSYARFLPTDVHRLLERCLDEIDNSEASRPAATPPARSSAVLEAKIRELQSALDQANAARYQRRHAA